MRRFDLMLGVVVIGRNEAVHLEESLLSVLSQADVLVYVDSASTDGSVAVAKSLGVDVIELSASCCLNAGRARNEGMRWMLQQHPKMEMVQFLDADCVLKDGWLSEAHEWLEADPMVGAVCGRRRERFGWKSIYNRLCDIEWNTPTGLVKSFGGDVMVRVLAFEEAGGFHDNLPGGEEPDLSFRMRRAGWEIRRVDSEMSLHDAAILDFGTWWRRMIRGGYGAGWVVAMWRRQVPTGEAPFYGLTRSARIWTDGWIALLVTSILLGGLIQGSAGALAGALLAVLVFALQAVRIAGHVRGRGGLRDRIWYGGFMMIGKWAQRFGLACQRRDEASGRCARLKEYRGCNGNR